jgi:hypothetical protein
VETSDVSYSAGQPEVAIYHGVETGEVQLTGEEMWNIVGGLNGLVVKKLCQDR